MLKGSRVATTPDISRLAKAVSHPGIDPRCWVSLAIIEGIHVDDGDIFCDVVLHPSGAGETVRLSGPYAGNGFGEYNPLHIDDEVVILFPNGAPDQGGVVIARLWSNADPRPELASTNIDDPCKVIEPGKSWRVTTSDGGFIILSSENVRLAAEAATEQYVLGTTYRQKESSFNTAIQTFATAIGTAATTWGGDPLLATAFATAVTTAATALATAAGTMEGSAAQYLSNIIKGK